MLAPLRDGQSVTIQVDAESIELVPEDVSLSVENAAGWASAADGDIEIALSTALTPALLREGMARDFVRHIQQLRKDANLEIEQHIRVMYSTTDAEVLETVKEWSDYVRGETLADALVAGDVADAKSVNVGEATVKLAIAT
jgi:isoleucyl-tRNA synthetase